LGEIAGAAANFAELLDAAGMNSDARADCGAMLLVPISLKNAR